MTGGEEGIRYPEELPISSHRTEILDALRDHQVVVVAGETGSGKSTQLPKICLELQNETGATGWIGHTQPRRIAARSVAERVASELGSDVGNTVGYTVRFNDQVSRQTRIKLMTDGILLAEIQRDPELRRYGILIIDEAHERSLNIDFLLGYLRSLLPRRPELRLLITSATIDTERFARHFSDPSGEPAPVIEVSGRTYPVEMRYRPLEEGEDRIDGIEAAVTELVREAPGDILIFLPGERDIRDTADALGGMSLNNTEIVPLFARLSAAEQHRIFSSHSGRRIVLATNIAETSLTVPGIRYVIDPGEVRMSRYNQRTKVQRLPIEPVSQASANQRAGRCGRIGPGICIRLYDKSEFDERPEFTDPEITRTNLASVILQMASIGLAPNGLDDVVAFPFVESPDTRNISDGVNLLEELGAVDLGSEARAWVTPMGRRLARLPVDPRIARMVLAADDLNCLDSVLVIAAALSIQDPREEPSDKREVARQSHARFRDESSDMMSLLLLWDYINAQRRERSSGSFRRMCRKEFLNHNRLREWQDLYSQLKRVAKDIKLSKPIRRSAEDVDADAVHRALLTGLLSQIGLKEERDKPKGAKASRKSGRPPLASYVGARQSRFVIAPGSSLTRSGPRWVMAGELVETNQLYARMVAPLDPRWIEDAAEHLATYSYSEPTWRAERGTATVVERATLYGLPIVTGRTINLYRVDPELARTLFIQGALVDRDWEVPEGSKLHRFLDVNDRVLAEAARWEAKTRNRSLEVEAEVVFEHYDRVLPSEIVSVRHFEKWWKKQVDADPAALDIPLESLLPEGTSTEDFPDRWPGTDAVLGYTFEPGSAVDGVTVSLPAADLASGTEQYSWLVPGYRTELVTELLRTLPKDTRTRFIPLPDTAERIAEALDDWPQDPNEDIAEAIRSHLVINGVPIERGLLRSDELPSHLRPVFQAVDADGQMLAAGRDLTRLVERVEARVRSELQSSSHPLERRGLTEWPGGTIPRTATAGYQGATIEVFPSLVDRESSVDLIVLATAAEQSIAHWNGVRRLLRFTIARPVRIVAQALRGEASLALAGATNSSLDISQAGVVDDLVNAVLDSVMLSAGGAAWTETDMRATIRFAQQRFEPLVLTAGPQLAELMIATNEALVRIAALTQGSVDLRASLSDARSMLGALVYDGFLSAQGVERLPDVTRYVQALVHRLEQLPGDLARETEKLAEVQVLQRAIDGADDAELSWMLHEYRVSLWAQQLGTNGPISSKRILNRLNR